jgi:lysophospholipase L1-like esterase
MARGAAPIVAALLTVAAVASGSPGSLAREGGPATMYVLGDSWSAGLHADPDHTLAQDAAEDLGMDAIVDAQSGTGYLAAPLGTETYPERATAAGAQAPVRVVVLQGGSNDDHADLRALPRAVAGTVAAARRAFPHAAVVLLGPGPDPWPITGLQRAVDRILARTAARVHAPYISPMREGWFTGATVHRIIDPDNDHPTVEGDRILGARLAADLRPLLHPAAG